MICIHGWVVILEAFKESDESNTALYHALKIVGEKIDQIINKSPNKNEPRNRCFNTIIECAVLNGSHHMFVMADWNHKDGRWYSVLELYQLIAKVAPGSYGVLHVRDDEDSDGYENAIQAYVLRKGKLKRHKDPFLSPCIPMIEEIENDLYNL